MPSLFNHLWRKKLWKRNKGPVSSEIQANNILEKSTRHVVVFTNVQEEIDFWGDSELNNKQLCWSFWQFYYYKILMSLLLPTAAPLHCLGFSSFLSVCWVTT